MKSWSAQPLMIQRDPATSDLVTPELRREGRSDGGGERRGRRREKEMSPPARKHGRLGTAIWWGRARNPKGERK